MENQTEKAPLGRDLLTETNAGNIKKIADSFGLTADVLNQDRVYLICGLAWRQPNEDLHALGITRSWLRMFISRCFCNRSNVPAGDWTIEKALKV